MASLTGFLVGLQIAFGWALLVSKDTRETKTRPNFVYVLTDDMSNVLGDETIMPQTRQLVKEQGVDMPNFFATSPVCSPVRQSWMSGRYYHNLRPDGATTGRGLNTTSHLDIDALFPLLHKAGYQTAIYGKITNDQGIWLCDEEPPKVFTHIEAQCKAAYDVYDFVYKEDDSSAAQQGFQDDSYGTYYAAVFGNRSVAWIQKAVKNGNPFFLYIGTRGPHVHMQPAPWHTQITRNMNIKAPRTPNFNQPGRDHLPWLANALELDREAVEMVDLVMRDRWGTLLSIDDMVAGIVAKLEEEGVLDNTYVLFSSDHGYHLGQFRIPVEKMLPYETDIRVPFYIRGPGITPGTVIPQVTLTVDIAPTLLDLAGLAVPAVMDGKSMVPLWTSKDTVAWRTSFICEFAEGKEQPWEGYAVWDLLYDHNGNFLDDRIYANSTPASGRGKYRYDAEENQWRQLRVLNATHDFSFMEFDQEYVFEKISFCEYYDLKKDPWQQKNLCSSLRRDERKKLHDQLKSWYECRGTRNTPSTCE